MKVTAFMADVEVTEQNDAGEVTMRSVKKVFALEAEMPIEFREWLLARPAVAKEG